MSAAVRLLESYSAYREEATAMRLVGCDLHARKQQVAMLDSETGEVQEVELWHHGEDVERFFPQVVSRWAVGATEGGRRPETL